MQYKLFYVEKNILRKSFFKKLVTHHPQRCK